MTDTEFIDSLKIKTHEDIRSREDIIKELLDRRSMLNDEIYELEEKLLQLNKEKASISDEFKRLGYSETLPPLNLGTPTIDIHADPLAKAYFLYDLFQGRRNAYPKRVYSKKSGSIVYSPQCFNFYQKGCPRKEDKKSKIKCIDCKYRNFKPVTPETILSCNLQNKEDEELGAIGIYVLREDNTCYFVAIDMDEKSYMEDAKAVLTIARNKGFQMTIERSRSGNGAHLWLFFSEPVEARLARELAFSFLEEAAESGNIKAHLASYDRIFPTQEALSENGLGNLILMPLIRHAAVRKCTVFLQDDLVHEYRDQLAYLSSVGRHSREEILSYLERNKESREEDTFSLSNSDTPDMLWKRELPRLDAKDFKKPLVLYLSSGITLDKSALSDRAIYYFKKLTSFSNQKYYQQIHLYDGYARKDTTSTIYTHEETATALLIPRSFLDYIKNMLDSKNIPYSIEDHRIRNTGLDATFMGTLKPEQLDPFRKLSKRNNGILKAATSFGKTVTAIALIAEKKERTLILVEKSDLVQQWKNKLEEFLEVHNEVPRRKHKRYDPSPFGSLQGTSDKLKGLVDVVMMQSLYSRLNNHTMPEGFLDNYGMVIVDECHHLAADTFCSLTKDLRSANIFGLTATEKREDGKEKIIYAHIGKVIEAVDAATLAYRRNIQQYFIPHLTDTYLPEDKRRMSWNELVEFLSYNTERNEEIVRDIAAEQKNGRHILVITKRTEHVDILAESLRKLDIDVLPLYGKMKKHDKEAILATINSPKAIERNTVLVATFSFIEEGSDIPHLDTLFITFPLSSEKGIIQVAGRIGRAYAGKDNTIIHDYVDIGIPQSEATYTKRTRIYSKLGYLPMATDTLPDEEILFTAETALNAILNSIEKAKNDITIMVPYITPTRNTMLIIEALSRKQDINVTVMIRRRSDKYEAMNQKTDEKLSTIRNLRFWETENSNPILLLIDSDEVWYGDLNYMALKADTREQEGTIMHMRNRKLIERMKTITLCC